MRQESMAGRPKPLRVHLREGMEAALKTEPRAFATAEPRTLLGMVIRELGLEAARGKTPAIKLMAQWIDWKEPPASEQGSGEANVEEQGVISKIAHEQGVISFFEPEWEWDRAGRWDTAREAQPAIKPASAKEKEEAAARAFTEIQRQGIREQLMRLHEREHGVEQPEANRNLQPGDTNLEAGRESGT